MDTNGHECSWLTVRRFGMRPEGSLARRAFDLIRVYSCSYAVTLLLLLTAAPAFANPAQDETRAAALFREVRCIQCQSESIADSNAPIAADMRRLIREDIAAGRSDAQIRDRLVARYSDYVLFRPRLSKANLLLWILPLLVVLGGGGVLFALAQRKAITRRYELTPEENEKLRTLLDKDG